MGTSALFSALNSLPLDEEHDDSDTDFRAESDEESAPGGENLDHGELQSEISLLKGKPKAGKHTLVCKFRIKDIPRLRQVLKIKKTKSKQASASKMKKPATTSQAAPPQAAPPSLQPSASAPKVKKSAVLQKGDLADSAKSNAPATPRFGVDLMHYVR